MHLDCSKNKSLEFRLKTAKIQGLAQTGFHRGRGRYLGIIYKISELKELPLDKTRVRTDRILLFLEKLLQAYKIWGKSQLEQNCLEINSWLQ